MMIASDSSSVHDYAGMLGDAGYLTEAITPDKLSLQLIRAHPGLFLLILDLSFEYDNGMVQSVSRFAREAALPLLYLVDSTDTFLIEQTEAGPGDGYIFRDLPGEFFLATVKMMQGRFLKIHSPSIPSFESEQGHGFDTYFRLAPSGIFITDEKGRYLEVNAEACQVSGYSEEELVGMRILDLIPDGAHEAATAHFASVVETGRAEAEIPFSRKDGERRYWSVSSVRLSDERYMDFVYDVTSRKQMEEKLVASEARFKALCEAPFGGIAIHDKGVVLACNDGLCSLTGFSREELIGMDAFLVIAEEQRERVRQKIEDQESKPCSTEGLRKDGSRYPLRIESRNVLYDGRRVRVTEFRDITSRKTAEMVLQDSVKEKETNLRELQHRVKNSFGVILSLINFKQDAANSESVRSVLSDISARVRVLSDLYCLLYRSRERGQVALNEYVEMIANTVRLLSARIAVRTKVREVQIDAKRASTIGLILIELLTNSVKHAFVEGDSGTIEIALEAEQEDLVIDIRDNGQGFPEGFSLEESTGFGLALVYGMAAQLKAKLECLSESGIHYILRIPAPC